MNFRSMLLLTASVSLAPAQTFCPAIDFLTAREVHMAASGALQAPLLWHSGSQTFKTHPYVYSPPYRSQPVREDAQGPFAACLPRAKNTSAAIPPVGRPLGKGSHDSAQIADVGNGTRGGGWVGISGTSIEVFQTTAAYEITQRVLYPVGQKQGILTARIDSDTFPDLLVSGYEGTDNLGFVAFLGGRGDGTFQQAVKSPIGGRFAYSMVLTDFDRDTRLDVVASHADGMVFLKGRGDGTFQAPVPIRSGFTQSLGASDWNGDGLADLAFFDNDAVRVALGNGDGTFRAPGPANAVASNPRDIAFADFNKDGKRDLAVSGNLADTVLLGNGDGTFSTGRHWILGREPKSIVTADLNGDGNLDIISGEGWDEVLFPNTDNAYMAALLGNGDGTFIGAETFLVGGANDIASADFNGDSRLDVLVGGSSRATVLLASATGGFTTGASLLGRTAVAAGDFNGDGRADFVTGDQSGQPGMLLYLGNGDGTFQSSTRLGLRNNPVRLVAADFNGDMRIDVAAVFAGFRTIDPSGVQIFLQRAAGGFDAGTELAVGGIPNDLVAADFNRDGRMDLAALDSGEFGNDASPGGLRVFLGRGDGTFAAAVPYPAGLHPNAISAGDLNGDGRPDLLVSTSAPNFGNSLAYFFARADGTFPAATLARTDFGPGPTAIADFNGDGRTDIVVVHCCGDVDVTYALGRGGGAFEPETPFPGGPDAGRLLVANLNGDAKPDLLLLNGRGGSGSLSTLLNISPAVGPFVNISAASFDLQAPVAPGSIVSAFGSNLAATTAAATLPLPQTLAGTSVSVRDVTGTDRNADLYAVSSGQVNYVMPPDAVPGTGAVTIGSQTSPVNIARVAPGIFQVNTASLAAAFVVRVSGGTQTQEDVAQVVNGQVVAKPIVFGPLGEQLILLLFGTGWRNRSALPNVTVTIDGSPQANLAYAGPQGTYPGLDQINVPLSRGLIGRGSVDVYVTVDGVRSRSVKLEFR